MSTRRFGVAAIITASSMGFLAGVVATAAVVRTLNARVDQTPVDPGRAGSKATVAAVRTAASTQTADTTSSTTAPMVIDDAVHELRDRHLEVPVRGATHRDLRNTFEESRDATRRHEAMDILAPRNTLVVAVEDGTIARLFSSKLGGTTVYQFDPSKRFTYYYAHLERYADGIAEGQHVARGQVLGYVGTSGNAPKDTPHLHFAIFLMTEKKQWWTGTPINPYEVWK